VNDVAASAAERTVEEIRAQGGEAIALDADVSERVVVESMIAALAKEWGRIDIVVSNAGTIHSGTSLADTDDTEWRRSFAVHVDGALHVSRAALPWLERSSAGRIILISSMWAQAPAGHSYGYVSAKGALLAFARNLARELAPKGICVNSLTPGEVNTRMNADKTEVDKLRDYELIPLGRWAEPIEVSYLVAFLASDEAAFITGQTIPINGGQVIAGY
jgi:NAD(P)-dependent dehydrogenase (short-subunit alcohol dehydrogenase family)